MHHIGVALDDHLLGDLHRAGGGDAADIVAAQVDQHQVLGDLLGIGQQILFPQEVPVGLVSTLLGGAYFMWCLRRL